MKATEALTAAAVIFAAQHKFPAQGCRGNELNTFPDDVIARRVCELAYAIATEYETKIEKTDGSESKERAAIMARIAPKIIPDDYGDMSEADIADLTARRAKTFADAIIDEAYE